MRKLEHLIVAPGATLRQAMQIIDATGCEIALVADDERRLLGTLTDGDIRRALLGGAQLDDPIDPFVHREYRAVDATATRTEVLDLMRACTLRHIPIVDEQKRLRGLHLLREIIGASDRPNWAVVMVGGRGERLRPLTDRIPKPMIKVAGRPILERIVLHLVGFGIRRVFLAVNYMKEVIEDHFGDGSSFGCTIDYLREQTPLGTGGALSLLPPPEHDVIVLNGDLVTEFDVERMLNFHEQGRYDVTVAVREYMHTVPFGVVQHEEGKVVGIEEKPTATWSINAGVYVVAPAVVARVPKQSPFGMPTLIESCLSLGERVGAFALTEDWTDVGRHDELRRALGELHA